jgi:hypothetical protein
MRPAEEARLEAGTRSPWDGAPLFGEADGADMGGTVCGTSDVEMAEAGRQDAML